MDFFFPEIRSDVRRTPIENFIEPGQEREHRDTGRRDVADGLREEDREHRVRQEVRQEEDERDEENELAQAGYFLLLTLWVQSFFYELE